MKSMLKQIFYFLLSLVFLGCQSPVKQKETFLPHGIYGGSLERDLEAVGAFLQLSTGATFCTGTLIDARHVLTAAHCVVGIHERRFVFAMGDDAESPFALRYHIDSVFLHPLYDNYSYIHDIAIVRLATEVTHVEPIKLAIKGSAEALEKKSVFFVGYGLTQTDEAGSRQSAWINIEKTGQNMFAVIYDDELQTGICFGDSGGPALYYENEEPFLIGVISSIVIFDEQEDHCLGTYGSTKIDAYLPWILEILDLPAIDCNEHGYICHCNEACSTLGDCDNNLCTTKNCIQIYECISNCAFDDSICYDDCYIYAQREQLDLFNNYLDCGIQNCRGSTSDEILNCLYTNCYTYLHECYNSPDCSITGGDCSSGKACAVENYGLTYCIPSQSLAPDSLCEPDFSLPPCLDGYECVEEEEGFFCKKLCIVNSDCKGHGGCGQRVLYTLHSQEVRVCDESLSYEEVIIAKPENKSSQNGCGCNITGGETNFSILKILF